MANPFRRKRASPDRYSGMVRGVRVRERKRLAFLRRKWVLIPLGIFLILAAGAGYGVYLYFSTQNDVQEVIPGVGTELKQAGEPETVLIVGSDSRAGLTEKEQQELGADDEDASGAITGERADTLILARIDPETGHIMMVQFPRDLWVPIPGSSGKNKINSALEQGKPTLVETVKSLTGLPVDRYVQINIAGFKDLVDAIDGVDVCIPEPIEFDPATGIEVKEPGLVHFSGERAVRFVRSRKNLAGGDLDRIQNQQKFMAAAIDKVTSVDTLLHLDRARSLLGVLRGNLRMDQGTGLLDLYRLGQRLRSFNPNDYEAYTAPNFGPGFVGDASVVLPDMQAMRVMFDAIARDESPADADEVPSIDPSSIRVGVYNGTYEEGIALAAKEKLENATKTANGSVIVSDVANAERFDYKRTVIVYNRDEPEAERMAELVSAAVPGAEVKKGKTASGIDVAVIVGREDFRTKKIVQILPIPIPKPGALPAVCRP
ncbi:MAG: LCP family protein [Actinobacteria bacterium]|nr:LCP family protein [Actinomycetota bacterium]